ncbi:MAG: N-acetyltransferase, partial [Bartonella sp.]|nr:N-acetyltransferase [Bartonella sp.]
KNLQETIPADQAKYIIDFFNAQKLPVAWWIGPHSSHYKVDEVLLSIGLEHVETEVGMVALAQNIDAHVISMPDNFKIKEVELLQDFRDYGNVMASVFSLLMKKRLYFMKQ